jgi:hypothetical protein
MKCPYCQKDIESDTDDYKIETPNLILEMHLDCAIDFEVDMEELIIKKKNAILGEGEQ